MKIVDTCPPTIAYFLGDFQLADPIRYNRRRKVEIHVLKRFFSYYRPYKHLFILDFTCAVVAGLLEPGFPLAVNQVVDKLLLQFGFFGLRTDHEQPHYQDHTTKEEQGAHSAKTAGTTTSWWRH